MNLGVMLVRALLGLHSVEEGSTCEISRRLWDVHDYPVAKGGDGTPCHWVIYVCPQCKKEFSI